MHIHPLNILIPREETDPPLPMPLDEYKKSIKIPYASVIPLITRKDHAYSAVVLDELQKNEKFMDYVMQDYWTEIDSQAPLYLLYDENRVTTELWNNRLYKLAIESEKYIKRILRFAADNNLPWATVAVPGDIDKPAYSDSFVFWEHYYKSIPAPVTIHPKFIYPRDFNKAIAYACHHPRKYDKTNPFEVFIASLFEPERPSPPMDPIFTTPYKRGILVDIFPDIGVINAEPDRSAWINLYKTQEFGKNIRLETKLRDAYATTTKWTCDKAFYEFRDTGAIYFRVNELIKFGPGRGTPDLSEADSFKTRFLAEAKTFPPLKTTITDHLAREINLAEMSTTALCARLIEISNHLVTSTGPLWSFITKLEDDVTGSILMTRQLSEHLILLLPTNDVARKEFGNIMVQGMKDYPMFAEKFLYNYRNKRNNPRHPDKFIGLNTHKNETTAECIEKWNRLTKEREFLRELLFNSPEFMTQRFITYLDYDPAYDQIDGANFWKFYFKALSHTLFITTSTFINIETDQVKYCYYADRVPTSRLAYNKYGPRIKFELDAMLHGTPSRLGGYLVDWVYTVAVFDSVFDLVPTPFTLLTKKDGTHEIIALPELAVITASTVDEIKRTWLDTKQPLTPKTVAAISLANSAMMHVPIFEKRNGLKKRNHRLLFHRLLSPLTKVTVFEENPTLQDREGDIVAGVAELNRVYLSELNKILAS